MALKNVGVLLSSLGRVLGQEWFNPVSKYPWTMSVDPLQLKLEICTWPSNSYVVVFCVPDGQPSKMVQFANTFGILVRSKPRRGPPAYGMTGSLVPWKSIIGIGLRPGEQAFGVVGVSL